MNAAEQDRRRLRYARAISDDCSAALTGTADAVMAVADAELEELRQVLARVKRLATELRTALEGKP